MMSSFPMNFASGYITTVALCGSKGVFMLSERSIRCQSMIYPSWHGGNRMELQIEIHHCHWDTQRRKIPKTLNDNGVIDDMRRHFGWRPVFFAARWSSRTSRENDHENAGEENQAHPQLAAKFSRFISN
jgi:hypothetical protein